MSIKKIATNLGMVLAGILVLAGCNGEAGEAQSQPASISVEAEKVVDGISIGWGIAFLPEWRHAGHRKIRNLIPNQRW